MSSFAQLWLIGYNSKQSDPTNKYFSVKRKLKIFWKLSVDLILHYTIHVRCWRVEKEQENHYWYDAGKVFQEGFTISKISCVLSPEAEGTSRNETKLWKIFIILYSPKETHSFGYWKFLILYLYRFGGGFYYILTCTWLYFIICSSSFDQNIQCDHFL